MSIQFTNVNSVWASILVETLYRLGLTTAIVCPGSRSAPLTIAFAQHPEIEAIPVLDERSAAFFALGIARQTYRPVVLICTSGTAGANFYPAVIEAQESGVPLLVLTADRPPELRNCNAGQAIDQQKLYGSYVNHYSELALPDLAPDLLDYLRQTVVQVWEQSLYPTPGCVQLNIPFREPLAPIPQAAAQALGDRFDAEDFFAAIEDGLTPKRAEWHETAKLQALVSQVEKSDRGLVIAGVAQPQSPSAYCQAIAHLAKSLRVPVFAEGLSPVRNYADLNPYLISTYDLILRNESLAESLLPDWVIRVGEMPTSKELRQWLSRSQPRQWVVDPGDRNLDPLHGKTIHLRRSVMQLAEDPSLPVQTPSAYLTDWCNAEVQVRQAIDQTFQELDSLMESKVAWLLSQHLPTGTPLWIANSTPVRDMEWFWKPGNTQVQPFFNRGANGIDGTLSSALGMAHHRSGVLLTGDLALLHDTNGFLLRPQFQGHLTIVLINNKGGGIFELLPISRFDPPFEEFFATPQAIDFVQLCATYGVTHEGIQDWEQLIQRLNPLPISGIRVLEVRCDRKADARWRKTALKQFAQSINPEY
jgi:2-succinyl-5-enolpyruvyl-6-hydroxy-3-cyclohexene-1-carboxylate synthase